MPETSNVGVFIDAHTTAICTRLLKRMAGFRPASIAHAVRFEPKVSGSSGLFVAKIVKQA